MSQSDEIERFVKEPNLLLELYREVIERLDFGAEDDGMAAKETQLREISRAIDKLYNQGVPVPEALRSEKTRLVAALSVSAEAMRTLHLFADEFEQLLIDLRGRIGRASEIGPNKKYRTKRSKVPKTARSIFRKLIMEGLEQLGGSAHKNDLYRLIERNYSGRFLPGDFDYLPDGRRIAWENYCDWEGTQMRKDGVLKTNSPRGIWELNEGRL